MCGIAQNVHGVCWGFLIPLRPGTSRPMSRSMIKSSLEWVDRWAMAADRWDEADLDLPFISDIAELLNLGRYQQWLLARENYKYSLRENGSPAMTAQARVRLINFLVALRRLPPLSELSGDEERLLFELYRLAEKRDEPLFVSDVYDLGGAKSASAAYCSPSAPTAQI